ncbi:Two-pore potassium channel [Thalictrum thalictroides]|uniref:Two-pore potassium channel n=1 Tax=Thalictrum thalictroides TaxID=46969 RepID=A0A7J6VSW0_THATH|nr:Two-pore potassium channel [Thalictrum thalictroides]
MANSDVKQPRASALLDPLSQPTKTKNVEGRFRHCKSAPTDLFFPQKKSEMEQPKSLLANFHPSFLQVSLALLVYLGVGTLCFALFRHHIKGTKTNATLDAMYLCIVTMTTVGYGDLVPNSVPTKLLASASVFAGMALVGLVLSKAADYLVEKQEMVLVKALHFHEQVGRMEVREEIKTNKVRYKLVMIVGLLLLLMIVGTIFLSIVENFDFVDAFYCVCCTITTLGYGDKSFSTVAGRIFAIFWILTSTICVAQFFLYLAELNTEHRQHSLVNWVLKRRMTHIDLEAADLDGDGNVSAPEFIIYKLKEMGKISQEDIALILREFRDLDVDQTGTLSASDLKLSQSSPAEN